ncbi:pentatricopeptide repeat-containing protein At1g18900-like [Cornus florida]|uniref:pentatricopeptide repeat-containing protein At1g18900-like n=1 Tax=Cornus florida TaxID=4283 RepID=UPI00289C2620|nr:pentatricopeptide repeat-containing protein At1g18900-like [Cornus florida]XP_059639887.1 pentatricopeptide repeat-containing protein At1g18900-like [Cornus florida]
MLRTKQLGTLSQSARSFFLGGPRSAADGSSCTSPEDETCVSKKQHTKKQHTRNEARHAQTPSTLVPETSTKVGSLVSGDAVKVVNSHKAEGVDCSASLPQVISANNSSGRADCVSYAGSIVAVQKEMVHSPPIADQFVRAGIAAVSFLSDLVNYKIPLSDESGMPSSPHNCMVNPARPLSNIKPSNVKNFRKDKIRGNPSAGTTSCSEPTSNSNDVKGRGESFVSVKGVNHVNDTVNSVGMHGKSSDSHDRKRYIPQKSKAYSNCSISNIQSSEGNISRETTEIFKKLPRDAKIPKGVAPTANQFPSTGHLVEKVTHILRQLKWGPATEEALKKLNCSMDAYQANQILKQVQDHSVALAFFYWLKRQTGFRHDGHTYTTMVGILGRAKQFGAVNKLLEQMIRDGCQPNVVTYNRIIHSYGRANYLNAAVNVFNQMQEAGCEPDRVTYCTLIDIHAKAGYLDFAMEMYQRMQRAGLSPDTFTYSVIINCLGKAGHLAAAHKLFCEMVDQGCVPNLVTYNIMIALQAKARNYPHALQLYRDMQNAGFEPDKVTYSIVMEVLGHCGYLEEAEAIFTEMMRKNWVPDEPVYGLLVDLWGKAGNAEKAWGWYRAMLNAGLRPNVPTCNSLLSAFLRVHRLSDAYNLLQSMLSLGLNPSLQTYTLLLSCCTEAQTSFDMGFCGELMAVTGHPAHMFLLSMPSSGPDGQNVRDHVTNFLDLMHSEDRESKRGLVDAVVDFLHKSGLKEEAGSVWEVAAQKNVYPDAVREKSSSYWLINLHVMSDGTAVTALSRTLAWFHRQMLVSGNCPSRIDIVTGWGRRSKVTGASLVRQSVQELLNIFSFPFFTENGNSGCFVSCGEPLSRWLIQSYVERMHLL